MVVLGHLLLGSWLHLARVTLLVRLVPPLNYIPRITATSSCSVQLRNRIRGWGEFWHGATTTTTAICTNLRATTAILRRTSPVSSTCCTCCAPKGSIHYCSAFAAKCACAAVPSGRIRIHSGVSTTTAYRKDLRPLRSSSAVAVLSEMWIRDHNRLNVYDYVFDGAYGYASQLTKVWIELTRDDKTM